jgi:hypothetical protein
VRKTTVLDVMRRLTQTKNIMVRTPLLSGHHHDRVMHIRRALTIFGKGSRRHCPEPSRLIADRMQSILAGYS